MNDTRYSLCPNCDACPEVVVQEDAVLIGGEGNQARLTTDEWNVIVAGVKSGALTAAGGDAAPAAPVAAIAASLALLRIGELARATGFTAKTLRYYEEVRLLQPSARSESGYRLYGDEAVSRLRFVRRAKGLGLALIDIRAILEISDEGRVPCEHVAAIIERDLAGVDAQFRRLRGLKRDLLALKARMSDALTTGSATPGGGCPCFEEEG